MWNFVRSASEDFQEIKILKHFSRNFNNFSRKCRSSDAILLSLLTFHINFNFKKSPSELDFPIFLRFSIDSINVEKNVLTIFQHRNQCFAGKTRLFGRIIKLSSQKRGSSRLIYKWDETLNDVTSWGIAQPLTHALTSSLHILAKSWKASSRPLLADSPH